MPKNTDLPECTSREITHYIVGQFKDHFSGMTDAGFRCHCGHKGGVQFTDYQAMTSPVAWVLPSVVCDRVIATWRAHTKDLDGVHPNAEDQIRDFFSRQLEQPGGPTMNDTPRYPLTAIPLDTPKPKSITISAFVDEDTRRIIADYAKKLDIAVVPVEGSRLSWTFKSSFDGYSDWIVTDRPTGLKSATPAAMREYLARLLGADVQTDVSEELHEVAEELKREDAEASRVDLLKQVAELSETAKKLSRLLGTDWPLERAGIDRPTRIILRSYAADDKPRIERLLGLARQLQIPVQLAGPWSCTAFPKGEEAHPALDVVFPEVLVHPRDLLICEGDEKRLFSPSLTEAENQILWAAREEDQRFITGLIELLGLHAEASRADIAAAVEAKGLSQPTAGHPGWMECLALSDRVRNILGAVDGEETDEAARRFVEEQKKVHSWRDSVFALRTETAENQRKLLGLHAEADLGDIMAAVETNAVKSHHLTECHRQRARYEECDAQVRDILGAAKGEESVDAAKRVVVDLAEWKRGQESWKNDATTQRQETAENQRRLLDILNAGTVYPDWKHCLDYAEARMAKAAKFEDSVRDALKERLETAITAERQTIAQRIDLALTGNAVVTNLDTVLRVVEYVSKLLTLIADALDAPPGDRLVVKDDGSLNTTLADRVVGYFKRLYTAAGFTEPPQGGWSEILSNVEDTLAGECPLPSR